MPDNTVPYFQDRTDGDVGAATFDARFKAHIAQRDALKKKARETHRRFGANAIIQVNGGRGFVVETRHRDRYVITAADCLPHLPPTMSFSDEIERSYPRLLGALGENPWALGCCEFADPVADLAVLGAYQDDDIFSDLRPLRVARVVASGVTLPVRMLGLDGQWITATAYYADDGELWLEGLAVDGLGPDGSADNWFSRYAGLSGSPILDARDCAIAVFVTGREQEPHGPQPTLEYNLPGGLWRHLFGRRLPAQRLADHQSGIGNGPSANPVSR